ncbi:hypothetical protein TNCT_606801 [Trichonephila clavata]|uniref:Uncharacterized protein n=1 Tax=Trichonephila clavata TaxID=2740835 RepID=A0A8X6LER1_TRICU|nr:hypothetical protein TNCT_606801 [Trichonephila clavata]
MTWSFVKKKAKKKGFFFQNTRKKNSIYSSPSENNCFPVLCLNSLPKGERGAYVVQSQLMRSGDRSLLVEENSSLPGIKFSTWSTIVNDQSSV